MEVHPCPAHTSNTSKCPATSSIRCSCRRCSTRSSPRGGHYHIASLKLGEKQDDPSYARIEVRADLPEQLERILAEIHPHGAVTATPRIASTVRADMDGAFPEGFYCSTNFRTQVRLDGEWIDVEDQEMDCGIVVDPKAQPRGAWR